MYDERIVEGWIADGGEADWEPLERLLPIHLCRDFMYMHRVDLDDTSVVHAYKHGDTRMYVLIDSHGDTWESLDHGRYRRTRHSDAIEQVFPSPWVLHATTEDREALKEALDTACQRGNGDKAAGAHILPSSPAAALRWLP